VLKKPAVTALGPDGLISTENSPAPGTTPSRGGPDEEDFFVPPGEPWETNASESRGELTPGSSGPLQPEHPAPVVLQRMTGRLFFVEELTPPEIVPEPPRDDESPPGRDRESKQAEPEETKDLSSSRHREQTSVPDQSFSKEGSAKGVSLEGIWLHGSEGAPVAAIKDSYVWWSTTLSAPPSLVHLLPDKVQLDDKTAPLSSQELHWSDGSTWVREELQGTWTSSFSSSYASIRDWSVSWKTAAAPVPLKRENIFPRTSVTLLLDPVRRATYEPGVPAKLLWADGEVWTRIALAVIP